MTDPGWEWIGINRFSSSSAPGTFLQSGGINSTGTLRIGSPGLYRLSGGTLRIDSGEMKNYGSFIWKGGTLQGGAVGCKISTYAGSLFDLQFDAQLISTSGISSIDNGGIFRKSGGTGNAFIGATIQFSNSGTLEVTSGTLTIRNLTNTGRLSVDQGATLFVATPITVGTAGALSGGGTLVGDATVSGILDPGDGVGVLTVQGSLSLDSHAKVHFEIGTFGTDRVDVLSSTIGAGGDLTLGGTLDVVDVDGLMPGIYTLFTYQGVLIDNGVMVSGLPPGLPYTLVKTAGVVNLVIVPEPASVLLLAASLAFLPRCGRCRARRD